MTSNESKQKADLIWSKLFSKDAEHRTKQDELNIIESIVIEIAKEQRKIGRMQVLNYFTIEIDSLRNNDT